MVAKLVMVGMIFSNLRTSLEGMYQLRPLWFNSTNTTHGPINLTGGSERTLGREDLKDFPLDKDRPLVSVSKTQLQVIPTAKALVIKNVRLQIFFLNRAWFPAFSFCWSE